MAIFAWSITYIDGRNFAHIRTDGGFPNLSSSKMTKKRGANANQIYSRNGFVQIANLFRNKKTQNLTFDSFPPRVV